ncbi:hypothetical protein Bca52824_008377 [Brassica carinata]|uniref:Uncharacterized protein n=1 Tax=Brassica carinata TaxID=52824 RepID=A0A8X7W7Y8_BRACI|nr:hypothetical protein Bca52824_008377 [Brassica carinata]
MKAHRSVAGRLQRKPLVDCTNTVSRTSQQTSSSSAQIRESESHFLSQEVRTSDFSQGETRRCH